MANKKHLGIVQQGVKVWNQWTQEHPKTRPDLSRADLSGADLSGATLVGTNLTNAKLKECRIYGISVWDVQLTGAEQQNLVITDQGHPIISVDDLEVAQFIYLLRAFRNRRKRGRISLKRG